MAPKFYAEHIGSLIRPTSVLASSLQGLDAKLRSETLDAAVRHILQTQVEMGITPLTHGEYPHLDFFSAFFDKLKGFEARFVSLTDGFCPEIPVIRGAAASGLFKGMQCPIATRKIEWTKFAFEGEWMQIRRAIASIAEGNSEKEKELLGRVKLTIPSPIVDDPDLTYFCDETFLSALREDGFEPDVLLSTYLQAHSDATKNCPEGLVMGIHLCRGNFSDDLWLTKGGYENIARRLFTETGYDAFFLEYKTEKTGSLEPLRFLPKGMTIVLGLVSTKQSELENLDTLEKKVREAAAVIAREQGRGTLEVLKEQIAVSPQCGFASAEHSKAIGSEERMWEKLCLMRDLAERIWSM